LLFPSSNTSSLVFHQATQVPYPSPNILHFSQTPSPEAVSRQA
jgi:hypothetical protein